MCTIVSQTRRTRSKSQHILFWVRQIAFVLQKHMCDVCVMWVCRGLRGLLYCVLGG